MHEIGTALLYAAFLATLGNALLALGGAIVGRLGPLGAARHGLLAILLLFVAMDACLLHGLLTHDFRNRYIAAYTDVDMPLAYLIAGFWGGEKGALLFWGTSLAAFSAWAVWTNRTQSPRFLGYVTAVLSFAVFFFCLLMAFESSPFETFTAASGPDDGKGMNPLLQNPLMAIHPPSLLTGYIAFTVPFAFGMAALWTGDLDSQWLRDTRKWTLVSWLFLSLGLILGGAWAYTELGWGGFWMWDPVENAGLIPWFTATAFLHSVMIQERRNMLKRWNVVLVCLTFLLTIFGTFLTRSQLIDSVHAFADSTLATYFLWYMAGIIAVAAASIGWRWRSLRAEADLDSAWSRESFFVLNNVLLVGCAFVVLWGTVFGQISEAQPVQDLYNGLAGLLRPVGIELDPLQGKVQLGEPWFNRVMTPLGLVLLLLTGIGPLISWRRASRKNFEQNFRRPLVASSLLTLAAAVGWMLRTAWQAHAWQGVPIGQGLRDTLDALGMTEFWGATCVWFALFVVWTIGGEFHVGARARQRLHSEPYPLALAMLTLRNKRRYGGYVVHLGVVLCFLAFTGNAFRTYQPEVALVPGESLDVGGYTITYAGGREHWEADGAYASAQARMLVRDRGEPLPAELLDRARALLGVAGTAQPGGATIAATLPDDRGRALVSRFQVGRLAARLAVHEVGPAGSHALVMTIAPPFQPVVQASPQALMRAIAELKAWAKDAAPFAVQVRTTPGKPEFDVVFASDADRQQFVAWLGGEALPGVEWIGVNGRVQAPQGKVCVDLVLAGSGLMLVPEVRNYQKHQSPTTEVAIESAILHDLYLAMRPAQGQRHVSLLAVVFPFVGLLWLGAVVMLIGGFVCLLPARQSASETVPQSAEPPAATPPAPPVPA
ncbi:MAG: heme lyase CcmF/NrfE family subunit [Deltaproteobacteria bacterium]|nr:heme lyase CcmF/NrfE family subunit [Deltaproteobacteria bacterium]